MSKFLIVDRTNEYSKLVTFEPNLNLPFHRWYNLGEGYSSELVRLLIGEQTEKPKICADPFAGIGTTALTCQEFGIDCFSFENNPFFVDVITSKLDPTCDWKEFGRIIQRFERRLKTATGKVSLPSYESKTFFETKGNSKRWLFNRPVAQGVQDIKLLYSKLRGNDAKYLPTFRCALGEILIEISNMVRHGKALSYKQNWTSRRITRKNVHQKFLDNCWRQLTDLKTRSFCGVNGCDNSKKVFLGNSLELIAGVRDDQIDIVITSPPYLNSRDYTDIYRLELWMLDYVKKFGEERALRNRSLTSHVQKNIVDVTVPNVKSLKGFIKHLNSQERLWNQQLPNMVKGYFKEMEQLLTRFSQKLKCGGKMYINVSNSAYYGKQVEVDVILAEIASNIGYIVPEIRVARWINPSGQQKDVGKIRESIIVLEKQ